MLEPEFYLEEIVGMLLLLAYGITVIGLLSYVLYNVISVVATLSVVVMWWAILGSDTLTYYRLYREAKRHQL